MKTKDFKFHIKAVTEDGRFEGILSAYGVVDLGGDVVEPGAFTKTIQEQKGVVPLLWNHDTDTPVGFLELEDTSEALNVRGTLFTAESEKARELHGIAKRYQEIGRPMGLSIGYDVVKRTIEKGVRHLRELKLYEGSLTLFPMLPVAQLTSIKWVAVTEHKADFITELDIAQIASMRYMMMQALDSALTSILWDPDSEFVGAEAKIKASDESIQQFHTAYMEFLPRILEMRGEKAITADDAESPRVMSKIARKHIESVIESLQALLGKEAGTSTSDPGAAKAAEPSTPQPSSEPVHDHSALESFALDFRSALAA